VLLSPAGGAWGFKLDSLSKLTGTKTTDNSMTLLHYIASILAKQAEQRAKAGGSRAGPKIGRGEARTAGGGEAAGGNTGSGESDALLLLREIPSAEAAARVIWADEAAEVNALSNSLKQVGSSPSAHRALHSPKHVSVLPLPSRPILLMLLTRFFRRRAEQLPQQVSSPPLLPAHATASSAPHPPPKVSVLVESDTVPAFKVALGAFHDQASTAAQELRDSHAAADAACIDLAGWLAEEVQGGKAEPERIFAALHDFAVTLEKAHLYNVECEEREAKKVRMAAAAKVREEEMSKRKAGSPVGSPSGISSGFSAGNGRPGGAASPVGGAASPVGGAARKPPPGAAPAPFVPPAIPKLGFGGATNEEFAAKLAARANRANLVDGVAEGMATGRLSLSQRRQDSFARRGPGNKRSSGSSMLTPQPASPPQQQPKVAVLPNTTTHTPPPPPGGPPPPLSLQRPGVRATKPRGKDVAPSLPGAAVATSL
jgi:hypothetical protein